MPLTLVTGPANAAKARVVLDGYRAALKRGEAPILVVPRHTDVERYRSELASGGAIFGARVMRFRWLIEEAARRGDVPGRPLGTLARERVAAAAVSATTLGALSRSAATDGFPDALLRLVDELEERNVSPQRLTQALRAWAGDDARRRGYADDVAGVYASYRRLLERSQRRDRPLYEAAALDALRERPAAWGGTPVFIYGFDDLTPHQCDAVRTIAASGAGVVLSLAYEPGRLAFSGRATTFAELSGPDVKHVALDAREEHYAPGSRAALHHLERGLFEPGGGRLFDPDPVDPGDAVVLLQGGGERAELELVAAEAARLMREEEMAADEIAVVVREPDKAAALISEVFGELGVPVALDRRVAFGHTALGRGLLALLRCALLEEGTADDLLAWLRAPGLLQVPALADRLEARVRREGARSADAARALWEDEHWPLDAIDRVRDAHRRGGAALLERLSAELAALFAAPRRRAATVLTGPEAQDGVVLSAGRAALSELAALARADAALAPTPAELHTLLANVEVHAGAEGVPGAVTVASPLALRARRVRALFACRLQEGEFPRLPRPEPFFGDAERDQIAAASGLVLGRRDELGDERYLFYATVSRPEERLYLSWHESRDDGEQAVRSFFVADVCDLFGPGLEERMRTRTLGEVGWPEADAPTERERLRGEVWRGARRREAPIAPLSDPGLLAELGGRSTWSASAIELWASCPVKWLVERLLKPEGLTPDPELMLRGALAHLLLEATLRGVKEQTGSARLDASTLPLARELATAALAHLEEDARVRMSPDPNRQRALAHRLRNDVLRYLDHAAGDGSQLEPVEFEMSFGDDDERPPLALAPGVRLRGRIDRIDTGPGGEAIVYDYKGRTAVESAKWREKRRFQVALYMAVARDVLGLDPVGGLYQPIGGRDPRPRGVVLDDADPGLQTVSTDRQPRAAFEAIVDGVLDDVLQAVAEVRAGALEPRPQTCGYNDSGCMYPTICRCEAA